MTAKSENVSTYCEICSKKFLSTMYLTEHQKRLHVKELTTAERKVFECDFCGLRFLSKNCLLKHLTTKHDGGRVDKFKCDFDGRVFKSKASLRNHMKLCHRKAVKCQICGKEVKDMYQHMKFKHPKVDITVECGICKKFFKNQQYLKIHLLTHDKQHQCRVCGRRFALKTLLNEHHKLHENAWAFQCQICHKKSTTKSSLATHMRIHDENRSKPYECQHCSYSTDHKSSLTLHLLTHDTTRAKDLKCQHCSYKTDNRAHLKSHKRIHDPLRTLYPCPACEYEATTRESLTKHVKKHNTNRVANINEKLLD